MKEFIFMVIFFGFLLLFTLTVFCTVDSYRCKEIGKSLNYNVMWSYWTGCIIEKPNGKKVLLKQLRDFENLGDE